MDAVFPAIETLRRLLLEEKAIGGNPPCAGGDVLLMPMGQDGAEDRPYSKKLPAARCWTWGFIRCPSAPCCLARRPRMSTASAPFPRPVG